MYITYVVILFTSFNNLFSNLGFLLFSLNFSVVITEKKIRTYISEEFRRSLLSHISEETFNGKV